MVDALFEDFYELEVENLEEREESDIESDIFVFLVNIEDLLELDFSEDDENEGEIGWSRDATLVNTMLFILRSGVVSGVVEDGIVKDFF